MTLDPAHVEHARKVADAVLYEGYLLYPYRQTAQKNQARFQFGVLMPPAYLAADDSERSASLTECLAECADDARVEICVRYLQLRQRTVQAATPGGGMANTDRLLHAGVEYTPWDEAAECERWFSFPVADLLGAGTQQPFGSPSGAEAQKLADPLGGVAGRLTWHWSGLKGVLGVRAERVAGPYRALRLRVRVENRTQPPAAPGNRPDALRYALISAHVLIGIDSGTFLSMTDPPEWAAADVAACAQDGTWPVLTGPPDCHSLMLSAPVILPDHPEIAPESAGDLFDATEIDEILTLRTMALTDEEKAQARATDPRAAALLDRVDGLPPEMLERMHGAIRYLSGPPGPAGSPLPGAAPAAGAPPVPGGPPVLPGPPEQNPGAAAQRVPWWDPGADTSVSPETDHVIIAGVRVARGSRVTMRPGARRADAQDLFLAGREALVEAVLSDVDGQVHVAVSPVLDPLAELQRGHGRFLYFAPDEIEPLTADPPRGGPAVSAGNQSPRHEEEPP
jgi:hypothetical protein